MATWAKVCSTECYREQYKPKAYAIHKDYVSLHPKAKYKGSADSWKDIIKQYLGWRCAKCGSIEKLEIDHLQAEAEGGKHELANLQVLCHICHLQKTNEMKARLAKIRKSTVPKMQDLLVP